MASQRGLLKYSAIAETAAQPVYMAGTPYQAAFPYRDAVAIGEEVVVYLKGYVSRNPSSDTIKSVSTSTSGIKQTRFFYREDAESVVIRNILRSPSEFSEFSIYDALNKAGDEGVVFTWYPDFDNFPEYYFFCIMEKMNSPTMLNTLGRYQFKFDFKILPSTSYNSTVPEFT